MLRVRSGDYVAANPACYVGATNTNRCTICDNSTTHQPFGGRMGTYVQTFSTCQNLNIKRILRSRHNELVRLVRDAILHSNKGIALVYADLVATRYDQPPPQVTDEEWDSEPDENKWR
jgi:hypothetical protein